MKAKTKFEKLIVEENKQLKKIPDSQIIKEQQRTKNNYCYNNYFEIVCVQTKKVIYKRKKGEKWHDKYSCPYCKKKHNLFKYYDNRYVFNDHFIIYDATKFFQVVRLFLVEMIVTRKSPNKYFIREETRMFFHPNGKRRSISRIMIGWGGNYSGSLELRKSNYNISGSIALVGHKFHPLWRRNGINSKNAFKIGPSYLEYIIEDNRFESLFKMKQYRLAKYFTNNKERVNNHWSIIKRVSKYGYKIKDPSYYIDYLEMVVDAKYNLADFNIIAPINLKSAHDKAVLSVSTKSLNKKLREAVIKYDDAYQKRMDTVSNIILKKKNIEIVPLNSIRDIYLEGEVMSHCVFKSNYFKKSMIWSAKVNGEKMETLQVNPETLEVKQCRGYKNNETKYHDDIIDLWSKIHKEHGERIKEQRI